MERLKKYLIAALDQLSGSAVLIVILCIEFTVMFCCSCICYGALELYSTRQKMYEHNGMDKFYYVRFPDSDNTEELVKAQTGLDAMRFTYANKTASDYNVMVYDKTAIDRINVVLSSGKRIDTEKSYPAVPCYMTSGMGYRTGETVTLKNADESPIGEFYVCGIIENDVVFSPNYGFDYKKQFVIAYDPEDKVSRDQFAMHFYAVDTSPIPGFSERFKPLIDEKLYQSFDYYYSERNKLERDRILPYELLTIAFALLSLTGLLSSAVLSVEKIRGTVGIYYMTGAKRRDVYLILFLKNLMITLLPALVSLPVITYLRSTELAQTTLISYKGYLIAAAAAFTALIISNLILIAAISRKNLTDTLKRVQT